VRFALATEAGRMWKDQRVFRIPVLGNLLERATIARFARSFAIAHQAGVPIIQALRLGANVAENAWVSERIRAMSEAIPRGESLERAARNAGLFSPLALQMISVGEETGETSRMMNQLASFYEREVAHDAKRVGDVLEPLLVVFVGLIVLVLALGVYMPMWDLATAAGR
jgi:MSHA biogenesis protein MshG